MFNDAQSQAIEAEDGAFLVLAGPGTGKTTVVTQRVRRLIGKGLAKPGEILVVTFTNMAAKEMETRFNSLAGGGDGKVTFGTFHSIFFHILKEEEPRCSAASILSDADIYRVLREIALRLNPDVADLNEFITAVAGEIGKVKGNGIDPEAFVSSVCARGVFQTVYREYEKTISGENLMDFDDMLIMCNRVLRDNAGARERWSRKYRYILVDEFQDINGIQYENIKTLAGSGNLFVVGDDDQSIYGFRGSDPSIMFRFQKDFPESKTIELDINYRSDAEILKVSQNLISHNKKRFKKKIRAGKEESAAVGASGDKHAAEVAEASGDKEADAGSGLRSDAHARKFHADADAQEYKTAAGFIQMKAATGTRKFESAVDVREFETSVQQYRFIGECIRKYLAGGLAPEEIAVLVRNRRNVRTMQNVMSSVHVPVKPDEQPDLYKSEVAKDIIAYIQAAVKGADSAFSDNPALVRIANKPYRYISRQFLRQNNYTLRDLERVYAGSKEVLENIRMLRMHLQMIAGLPPFAAINYIRLGADYERYLKECGRDGKFDFKEASGQCDLLQQQTLAFSSLQDFLLNAEKSVPEKKEGQEGSAVRILTMHAAKGLEYHTVFIPDMQQELCPGVRAAREGNIEEERRIFYVALTRAECRLHISWAKSNMGRRYMKSQFIDEIYPRTEPDGCAYTGA